MPVHFFYEKIVSARDGRGGAQNWGSEEKMKRNKRKDQRAKSGRKRGEGKNFIELKNQIY